MNSSSSIPNEEQLRHWFQAETAQGLVDFKCFASTDLSLPSGVAVKDAVDMLREQQIGHFENLAGIEI